MSGIRISSQLPPFPILTTHYSSLITSSCHDAARDLQENVFEVGLGDGKTSDAHAARDQVFEQVVNVVGLADVFGVNGAPVTGRALDLRSLGQYVERNRRVAFDGDLDHHVAGQPRRDLFNAPG